MQNILLIAHLFGATAIGFLILKTFIQLYKNQSSEYKNSAIQIGASAGYQLATGSLLAFNIQTTQGLLNFCNKMGLYLGIVLLVESILFYRMQKNQNWIAPARFVFSSLSLGLVVTLATVFHIYGNI